MHRYMQVRQCVSISDCTIEAAAGTAVFIMVLARTITVPDDIIAASARIISMADTDNRDEAVLALKVMQGYLARPCPSSNACCAGSKRCHKATVN